MRTVTRALRKHLTLGTLATVFGLGLFPASARAQQTDPADRMAWYAEHEALTEASFFAGLPWQFVGPTNISGRMTDIAAVQPRGESYRIFVAGASGGVWRTDNEGVTWEPVLDHGPSTSIGDVTVAPSDPNVVWVGTGEANIFRSGMAGAGVFKSTDGGDTWEHKGLVATHTIPRIVIHPTNPDLVYVAASGHEWTRNEERGVYRTRDGGDTWEKVLYVDDETGAIDLVMHPTDPNTLYAATWQRTRLKWHDPRNHEESRGSGVFRSTDGGDTWTPINEGLPEARYRGRIGIDIARSNPDVLYAFVDNYEIARPAPEGQLDSYGRPMGPVIKGATVYRSDDGGGSWRRVSEESQYMERLSATYGWVFGQIRVDPNDENTIYVMGLALNVSNDGGRTFRRLDGMHGDHHGLWIDPANSDYLINVNDGGVDISYDGGENWRAFNDNLPLVQFFNVNADMAEPFRVYGSIQDHGSRRGVVDLSRGRGSIPAVAFENAPGGEGSHHAIDPTDPNTVYSAGFYGNISRTNMETGENVSIMPQPEEGELAFRGQWLAPFIISPHNPRIIYHGLNYLFRSLDRGEAWERISPDLTHNRPDQLGDIPYQTIFSISESPLRFGLIYVGTDDGRVHVTRDGGASWTEIVDGLVPDRFASRLVASAYDEGTVYLAQNGKRDDDFAAYLWRSTNYGETWEDITSNLSLGPVNVIREDPKNRDVLYVGTDVGAYVSVDRGASWHALANGMPSTFVSDMVIHPRDDILVASTHGRGMFALDVRNIQKLTPAIAEGGVHLFETEPGRLAQGFGSPSRTVSIQWWNGQRAGPATVAVKDVGGNVMRTFDVSAGAGLNGVVWDLTWAGQGGDFGGGRFRRGGVAPGTYTIEVTSGGTTVSGDVDVNR